MNFYPLLNEYSPVPQGDSKKKPKRTAKIEECKVIYTAEGKAIDIPKLLEEIDAGKTAVVTQSPLYAPHINYLTQILTFGVKTMATDGQRLFINPEFAASLSWNELIFVIMHEMMHCLYLHMERKGDREHRLFNIAADYEINTTLVETVRIEGGKQVFSEKTVKGGNLRGLYDKKYLGQACEIIYDELLTDGPPPGYMPDDDINDVRPPGGSQGGDPGGGGGGSGPIEIQPGMKVRIKSTGEKGIVTQVNSDGTYEVDPINESATHFYPLLNEQQTGKFKREDLVPIMPGGQGGGEGGEGGGPEGEYEIEDQGGGQEAEGDPDVDGTPGTGVTDNGEEVEVPVLTPEDFADGKGKGKGKGKGPGGEDGDGEDGEDGKGERKLSKKKGQAGRPATGGMITTEQGDKLAKQAGWDIEETREASSGAARADWKAAARKLYRDAQSMGAGSQVGGIITGILGPIVDPKVDWVDQFAKYLGEALSEDKIWRVGNRRHTRYGQKVIRYGRKPKRGDLSNIAVLVDVSGSMSHSWLEEIVNEITGMVLSKKVETVTVVFFDGEVAEDFITVVRKADSVYIPENGEVPGGGGTNFQNPINWVAKNMNNPDLVIMCTDGYAPIPKKPEFSNKFLWLLWGDIDEKDWEEKVGWGDFIKVDEYEEA